MEDWNSLCPVITALAQETQFRFPETSIGIFPGLGGTQRPARIAGLPLARWAVLAGNFMDARTAADLGMVTNLVDVPNR